MLLKYCCLKRDFSPCREEGKIVHVLASVVEQVEMGSQAFSSGLEMCGFLLGLCKYQFLGEAPSGSITLIFLCLQIPFLNQKQLFLTHRSTSKFTCSLESPHWWELGVHDSF